MARIIPSEMKDGDALEPWHINYIFAFIRRWMKFDASPPLNFDNNGESPPHLSLFDDDDLVPIVLDSGIAAGSYGSPASASCTLLIEYQGGPEFTETGTNSATCFNPYTTAIGSGKFAWAKWRGPYLYLVVGDC